MSNLVGCGLWRLVWLAELRDLLRELLVRAGEEEAGEGLGVGDLAACDQDRQLGEVDLFEADRLIVHQILRPTGEAGGEEEGDPLGAEAGGGVEADQQREVLGTVAGFLLEFARCGRFERLAGLVEGPGGDLEEDAPGGVAILADHDHPPVGEDRHDGDRAGVQDDLAHRRAAILQAHLIAPHRQEFAGVDRLAADDRFAARLSAAHHLSPLCCRA